MKLSDLLEFDDIVIQCHDNPDADALASGYALWWYFRKNGKEPVFIYRGINEISKSNIMIMVKDLEIPVRYEPDFDRVPELLITCDCQHGQRNVTTTPAKTVAIIDHHQVTVDLPALSKVNPGIGSCATVVWNMIKSEGLEPNEDRNLATALYYGLFTDTNKLSEVSHPLDRDMLDALVINRSIITKMCNSNISLHELRITGKAILDYDYNESDRYLIIRSEPCDPNILGVISDFSLETEGVDICVAFYESPEEVKFSVRSCVKEVHANELASFIAEGIGGGGGHLFKAGGTIRPELIDREPDLIIRERLGQYFETFILMYAKDTTLNTAVMERYEKLPVNLGAVRLADIFDEGTRVEIRTLEGDVDVTITDDTYLMIGVEGEVYPISGEKLSRSYEFTGFKFSHNFEYEPSVRDLDTGKIRHVMPYARTVISPGSSMIYARPLENPVKLFTAWDDEKYYSGNIGDYIAVREDDPHDIYIIKGRLFDKLYRKASF